MFSILIFNLKLSFRQPLLQSSVSHDPSEIIIIWRFDAAQESFLIVMLKTFVLPNIL